MLVGAAVAGGTAAGAAWPIGTGAVAAVVPSGSSCNRAAVDSTVRAFLLTTWGNRQGSCKHIRKPAAGYTCTTCHCAHTLSRLPRGLFLCLRQSHLAAAECAAEDAAAVH